MDLGFTLLCDASQALNGKVFALGGGWNMLHFPQLPQEFGFSIALGVDVAWDETNRRRTLSVRVEDPDGVMVGDAFTAEFEAGRPAGAVAGQEQRVVLSLANNWTFSIAGPHAVVVDVDDVEIGRSRFYVVHAPVSAGPVPGMGPA